MSNLPSWIARKYFFSKAKTRFLPFLTLIAIGGVAIGTCAMVVIISVMQGFNAELEKRLLGFNSHITVTVEPGKEGLNSEMLRRILTDDVLLDAVPFVEGEVIAEAMIGDELFAQGARLRGVDPSELGLMKRVKYSIPGDRSAEETLESSPGSNELPGIILGGEMLATLAVHPDFRDVIDVIAPLADIGPTGEMEPRLKKFLLAGSFLAGVYEYDTHYVLVNIDQARKLLGLQATSGWQLRVKDPHAVPLLVPRLKESLGDGYTVEGWHQRNRKLFAALKLERIAMGGVLALVVMIASFSIIGVIMMVVSSKKKDISLLQTMGMRRFRVSEVFVRQGMWIGIMGSAIGCLLGLGICWVFSRWPIQLPESYYVETLVVQVEPWWLALVAGLGVALAVAAALYPVWTAVREDPIKALRYE